MDTITRIGILAMALVLMAPGALADGHDDEGRGGITDAAAYGLCQAYETNGKGREASGASNGNGSEEERDEIESSPAFAFLESRAAAENQTTEEYCASQSPPSGPGDVPGAPDDLPGAPEDRPGAPDDQPGAPDDTPTGPPSDPPTGPPSENPDGPEDRPPRG